MTMRWRGKRRDSLQADIRAYSRYRYAYLTTFFSSFSPLHLLPLKVIQDLCTTYCPLDVASAEWNLLLRFRAGNASSNSHTCILRYLCASVSTRALAPLNIFYIHWSCANTILRYSRPLFSFLSFDSNSRYRLKKTNKRRILSIYSEFQNSVLSAGILKSSFLVTLKQFGKILAIHPSVINRCREKVP